MKFSIMSKLMFACTVVLLLALAACLYLVYQIKNTANDYDQLINQKAYAYAWMEAALAQYNEAAANVRGYIISGKPEHISQYQQAIKDGDNYVDKVVSLLKTKKEKQIMADLQTRIFAFKQYGEEAFRLVKAREDSRGSDRIAIEEQLMELSHTKGKTVENLTAAGEELGKYFESQLSDVNSQNLSKVKQTIRISIALVAIMIILGLIFAYIFARMITGPIRLINAEAAKIAAGDLTGKKINLRTKDETGDLAQSFNIMLANLKEIAGELQAKSQMVASSAAELTAGTEAVTAGSEETASAISQVAGNMEQITANVQRISDVSTQADGFAREGSNGLENVTFQIAGIQKATHVTSQAINDLHDSAAQISQIVELITQIADQTNLLALNAAIEAARAGEHGRGFAVVAEEVRQLAEQSAGAAKEIYTLIMNIQQDVQRAVQVMEDGTAKVDAGTEVVKNVGKTFEKIIAAVQGLAGDIQSVNTTIENTASAVQNVAAASEEQTATMDELSSTTQNLSRMAEELDSLAGRFKLA
ncbi:methyl-accepting chemotaxis protein [Desulfotruncus alcoholivorax]|uniref:methyl-accepting chemotaxis protein n=1 Tax=Desulfotruncus alcoholivorax TaxID=265477 RepID=UPI0004180F00|nr:methyl-accepting chemotaxis protein [Desulfotruncus alcoholivorax]